MNRLQGREGCAVTEPLLNMLCGYAHNFTIYNHVSQRNFWRGRGFRLDLAKKSNNAADLEFRDVHFSAQRLPDDPRHAERDYSKRF